MIADDLGKIGRARFLRNDCSGIRDVPEERSVGKESAARHEDDPCVWSPITREVGCGDGTAILQHHVQDQNVRSFVAQKINRLGLARDNRDCLVLSFQVVGPNLREIRV